MKTSHKHAELIKAWADGAQIQVKNEGGHWADCIDPYWSGSSTYRIKPEPKQDIVLFRSIGLSVPPCPVESNGLISIGCFPEEKRNIKLIFDGETGRLKSAEVI